MPNCKNCKYTDEYCASGDCTAQNDLTEQYKHGNLPDDRLYYYRFKGKPEVQITTQYGLYCEEADNKKEIEVIDFVPSYEEYERILVENVSLKQIRDELDCSVTQLREDKTNLEEENNKLWQANKEVANRNIDLIIKLNTLKELLRECELWFTGIVGNMNDKNVGEHNKSLPIGNFEYMFKVFSQKINEVLNAK